MDKEAERTSGEISRYGEQSGQSEGGRHMLGWIRNSKEGSVRSRVRGNTVRR